MTRGNFVIILNGDVYMSTQFNGDMYPEGHGAQVYNMLKTVKSMHDFENVVQQFNEENFGYDDCPIYNMPDLDFRKEYFSRFNSDYLYIKNLDDSDYVIYENESDKSVKIGKDEIQVYYYGSLVQDPAFADELSSSDTDALAKEARKYYEPAADKIIDIFGADLDDVKTADIREKIIDILQEIG